MVYAQHRICPSEWDAETPLGFLDSNGSPNLSQTTSPYNNQQKNRTGRIVDFAVQAGHRVKLKKYEKKYKYLDLAWELKKTLDHQSDDYTNCDWCFWYSQPKISTRNRGLGNNGMGGDCQNHSIIESD